MITLMIPCSKLKYKLSGYTAPAVGAKKESEVNLARITSRHNTPFKSMLSVRNACRLSVLPTTNSADLDPMNNLKGKSLSDQLRIDHPILMAG
jgi:hypothetical protein